MQDLTHRFDWRREKGKIIVTIRYDLGPGASGHDASAGLNGVPNGDVSGDALGGSAVVTQVQPPSDEVAPPAVNGDVTMDSAAGINGSAHETAPHAAGVNGDVSMELHPQHLQDQQQQQPEVEQPAQQQHQQSESEQLTQDGQYLLRDLPIFTMNLEKMQKKLYYNGYLSCSTFMDDLGKIVANAEEAQEVDADRVFRAHQMRNLAIVLMDQYVDSNFKHECERMAQRQAVRDREAVEAAEKSKAAAAQAAVPPPRPAGMRHSARAEGKAPEYDHPVDVLAIERNNKRARRSSSNVPEQQGGEGIEGDAARKRARTSKSPGSGIETPAPATPTMMQPSGSDQAQLQLDPTAASAASAPGDPMLQSVPESMGAVGLPPREAQPNGLSLPSETKEASDELAVLASAAASDAAPAPAALPPFELDERKLDSLAAHLLTRTATFTIEQLEQLRAAWFDKVWRHRSFWDRNPLLEELYRVTEDFALAVAEEDAADQDL